MVVKEGKLFVPPGRNNSLSDSHSSSQYVQISCASEFCCVLDSNGEKTVSSQTL